MTTREDLENELKSRLQVAENSTVYTASRLTALIKNAYIWATQITVWRDLVEAKYSSTKADGEYYDYPEEFRSGTIFRLEIDGEPYANKAFEDYLAYKERNPDTTKKMFANFGRKFFICPTPSTTGLQIDAWGAIQADALSASSSVPIFSYNKEEGNEAVVQKAFSVAIKRTDKELSRSEEVEATATLLRLAMEEQRSSQREQRLDKPMFDVPDYFSGSGATPYQKFNYDPEDYS